MTLDYVYAAAGLRKLTVCALQNAAATCVPPFAVDSPGDTSTAEQQLPIALVRSARQVKRQKSKGTLIFTSAIEIDVQVQFEAETAKLAQAGIEALATVVEPAIITDPDMLRVVEEWVEIREQVTITSAGKKHNAELSLQFVLQLTEKFFPAPGVPLAEIQVNSTMPNPDGSVAAVSVDVTGLNS